MTQDFSDHPSIAASAGHEVTSIPVIIGPRFLNLFSENLYRSPNKAFEELISNSWDAGAKAVHVVIPEDLAATDATVWVLDDGQSMDVDGLRALWTVAESPKRKAPPTAGRAPIGKFGIGKLATYLLAHEVTYICRAKDGVTRAVTMDYRRILSDPDAQNGLHMLDLPLAVRELDSGALEMILAGLSEGEQIANLLKKHIPSGNYDFNDEFGGDDSPQVAKSATWTLCVLTSLKQPGREMQVGQIRRMLRAALPLGSSMAIVFNGESLSSSKIDAAETRTWVLGADALSFQKVILKDDKTEVAITSHGSPEPHLTIEGVEGKITGTIRLFESRISGGKSDERGASNGFHVNVKGRVVNEEDPYFGLENLSHSAWSKFRGAIRADGLDRVVAVNRDMMREDPALETFRSFLLQLFNMARQVDDSVKRDAWKQTIEHLDRSLGAVPLEPLHRVLKDHARSSTFAQLPLFLDAGELEAEALQKAIEEVKPADLISNVDVDAEATPDDPLVRYDIATRRVLVNQNHPFVREHSGTAEEIAVLRDSSLAGLLTDSFMVDRGIDPTVLDEVWQFRDQTLRRIALVRRRSGAEIARLLISTATWRGMETIVGDALDYLGFSVHRMGGSGEPEGVVTAAVTATKKDKPQSYTFTFDTKFSASGKAQTGNVHAASLRRHREESNADYTLVVAPSFQSGALEKECEDQGLAPMRAQDLGRLVMFAAANGPIDLKGFREVLKLHDPEAVSSWIDGFIKATERAAPFSLHHFFEAIAAIGFDGNAMSTAVIADRIKQMFGGKPTKAEVNRVAAGLGVLVPHLVQLVGVDTLYLSTTPTKLREAIVAQVKNIPSNYQFALAEVVTK